MANLTRFDLKRFRERWSLTQNDLAICTNVSIQAVRTWEQGAVKVPGPVSRLIEIWTIWPGILNELLAKSWYPLIYDTSNAKDRNMFRKDFKAKDMYNELKAQHGDWGEYVLLSKPIYDQDRECWHGVAMTLDNLKALERVMKTDDDYNLAEISSGLLLIPTTRDDPEFKLEQCVLLPFPEDEKIIGATYTQMQKQSDDVCIFEFKRRDELYYLRMDKGNAPMLLDKDLQPVDDEPFLRATVNFVNGLLKEFKNGQ